MDGCCLLSGRVLQGIMDKKKKKWRNERKKEKRDKVIMPWESDPSLESAVLLHRHRGCPSQAE
jgi:hypothetical protein